MEKVFKIISMTDDLKAKDGINGVYVEIINNSYVKILKVSIYTDEYYVSHRVDLDCSKHGKTAEENLEVLSSLISEIIAGTREATDCIPGSLKTAVEIAV